MKSFEDTVDQFQFLVGKFRSYEWRRLSEKDSKGIKFLISIIWKFWEKRVVFVADEVCSSYRTHYVKNWKAIEFASEFSLLTSVILIKDYIYHYANSLNTA